MSKKRYITTEDVQNKPLMQSILNSAFKGEELPTPMPYSEAPEYQTYDRSLIKPDVYTPMLSDDEKKDLLIDPFSEVNMSADDINELRVKSQQNIWNWPGIGPKFVARVAAKAVQSNLEGLGLLTGGTQWLLNGANKEDMSSVFDNDFNNEVDGIFNSLYESNAMKVYVPKKVKEGSLWDNLSSRAFWNTEGADAAGFFVGMMLPGGIIAKAGMGEKLAMGLNKIKPITNLEGIAEVTNNTVAAGLNTVIEAGAEASQTYKDIYNGLLDRGIHSDVAKSIASDKAASTFNANAALLIGPNLLMSNLLLGRFNPKGNLLIDVDKQLSKKVALKSGAFYKELGKTAPLAMLSEGPFEEGTQNAIQNYYKEKGLSLEGDKENNTLDEIKSIGKDIAGIAEEYVKSIPTLEYRKSIILGGLLGGLGGSVGAYRHYKQAQATIYGSEGPQTKLGKLMSKMPLGDIFVKEPKKDAKSVLNQTLIKSMPEAFSGAIQTDEVTGAKRFKVDGTDYEYNPNSLELFGKDKGKEVTLGKIISNAQLAGDKVATEQHINLAQFNLLKPYLNSNEGVEYLKKRLIPTQGDLMINTIESFKTKMGVKEDAELTSEEIENRKQDLIRKVDEYKKIYDEVNGRHDYETKLTYKPGYKQEFDNFNNTIKATKFQSKLDISHANKEIEKLENRNAELFSKSKLVTSPVSKLKEEDIVEWNGKKYLFTEDKLMDLESVDENGLNTYKKYNVPEQDEIKKVKSESKFDIDEILKNYDEISYHRFNASNAKKNLDTIYNNKELQKIFNENIKNLEDRKQTILLKETFKPNSYWTDKEGKKYKILDNGKLYEESFNEKGEPIYQKESEYKLDNPEDFKANFTKSEPTPIVAPETNVSEIIPSRFKVGDEVSYNDKNHKIAKINPDGTFRITSGNEIYRDVNEKDLVSTVNEVNQDLDNDTKELERLIQEEESKKLLEEEAFQKELQDETLRNTNAKRIGQVISQAKTKKESTINELVQIKSSIDYLEQDLDKSLENSGDRLSKIDEELNSLKELLASKKRPAQNKKLINKIASLEKEQSDIRNITSSIQNRIRELKFLYDTTLAKKEDLENRIDYYQNLLQNKNFKLYSQGELVNEIGKNITKLGTINKLIHGLEVALKKAMSMLNDIGKIITNRFKKVNEFRESKGYGKLNETDLTQYDLLQNELKDSEEYQDFLLDIIEKDSKNKEVLLDKAINLQNNIRYLKDLINVVKGNISKKSTTKQVAKQVIKPVVNKEVTPEPVEKTQSAEEMFNEFEKESKNKSVKKKLGKTPPPAILEELQAEFEGSIPDKIIEESSRFKAMSEEDLSDEDKAQFANDIKDFDIEGIPTPTGKMKDIDLPESNEETDTNPEVVKEITTETISVDTDFNDKEDNGLGLKRWVTNMFIGTVNNPNIGNSDNPNGNPNSTKANKVASDFNIFNGNYKLQAFKASDLFNKDYQTAFEKDIEQNSKYPEEYKYDDYIVLVLTDLKGKPVGLNDKMTELNSLPGDAKSYRDTAPLDKPFVFWSLRLADAVYKTSGEPSYFTPDVTKKEGLALVESLFDNGLHKFDSFDNKIKNPNGYTDRQNYALNLFEQYVTQLTKEHEVVRKNIESKLDKGESVTIDIKGHSQGIPSIKSVEFNPAATRLAEIEGFSNLKDFIKQAEVKVAITNVVEFSNGNKIEALSGYTYVFSNKSGRIYKVQPKQFSEKDADKVIDLLKSYVDKLNAQLANGEKVDENFFEKAEKITVNESGEFITYTNLGKDISVFSYINDIIHDKYLSFSVNDKETGRDIQLRLKGLSGFDTEKTSYPIFVFNTRKQKYEFNQALETELYDNLLKLYYRVKSLKLTNPEEEILDIKSIANGIVNGEKVNYQEYLLKNILLTELGLPTEVTINKTEQFGGGTMTFTQPVLNNVYIKMNLNPFKNAIEPIVKTNVDKVKSEKKANFKNRDRSKDETFRFRVGQSPYIAEDINEFEKWFAEKFPQFGRSKVHIIRGLLEKGIFGKVAEQAIWLDEKAEIGTGYHEAFHITTHYLLKNSERSALYNEWRERNPKSNLTDKEIEEEIAEDFRDYMLSDGKLKYPPIKENIFKQLLRWIRNFFKPSINKTFERIDSGYYAKRSIKPSNEVSLREKRLFVSDNPIQSSPEFAQELMQATNVYFFDYIRRSEGSFDSFFNKDNNAKLINDAYNDVIRQFTLSREAYQEVVDDFATISNPDIDDLRDLNDAKELVEHYDYILNQFKDEALFKQFRDKHAQELSEYGLSEKLVKSDKNKDSDDSTEYNEDNIGEGTNTVEENKDTAHYSSDYSIKFDSKHNASKSIKLLVGTLPKLVKKGDSFKQENGDILLAPLTMKFGTAFSIILHKMTGAKGTEEIIERLNTLRTDFPSVEYFFTDDGLGLTSLKEGLDIPLNNYNEVVQFVQTFGKTDNNFTMDNLNEGGKRHLLDTNLQAKRRSIEYKWKNNSSIIQLNPRDNKFINGEYNKDAFSGVKIDDNNPESAYEFLRSIGIVFTNKANIYKSGKENTILEISKFILKSIQKGGQIDLFNTTNLTDQGRNLDILLDIEYDTDPENNISSHIGPDGQNIYNHSLNSYISNIVDNINKFKTWNEMVAVYPHLNTDRVEYIKNSMLLKKGGLIFDIDGDRKKNTDLKLLTVEAISESEEGSKTEYSKISKPDRMGSVIDRLLSGQMNLIRPADKTLERFISIGDYTLEQLLNTSKLTDTFINYIKDEVNTYRKDIKNKGWKYISKNTEDNQGIYLQLLKDYNESPTKYNEFLQFLKSNKSFDEYKEQNRGFLDNSLHNYFFKKADELLDWLLKNEVIVKLEDGTYQTKGVNLGEKTIFSKEDLVGNKNYVSGNTKGMLYGKLQNIIRYDHIANTEQLKVLFGNPNYFKSVDDFFKRTGSFPGTKKLLIDDAITSKMVEKYLKRTDRAEGLVDEINNALVYSPNGNVRKKSIIKQIVFEDISSFDGVFEFIKEETDGSSIISFDAYREFLFRSGDWTFGDNSLEDLWQYEMQNYYGPKIGQPGYLTEEEYGKIFGNEDDKNIWNGTPRTLDFKTNKYREITSRPTPKINMLKPLHVGPYAEEGFINGITKTSFTILYPSMFEKAPNMEKLFHFMRKNQIGVTSFYSANKGITSKVNSNGLTNQLYVESKSNPGKYELNLDNLVFEGENANAVVQHTYTENWGIQLDTGFKHKDKVIYGTQMMKQILSYLYVDGKIKGEFSNLVNSKDEHLADEYTRLNAERLDLGKKLLLDELNIKVKDGEYYIDDLTKFKDKLKELADSRGMDDNTYDSINFIEPTLGMDILLNRNKFENALFSLNDAMVIKQKRFGGAFYQQPSTLHEQGKDSKGNLTGLRTYDKENGTLQSSEDLKAYDTVRDADGKIISVGSMEVMLPYMYKGVPIEELEDILRNGIAFRIPTQGLASIEAIKVVGFLDESAGDTIVLPSSIVKKAGSDYDIDKLNVYLPYVTYNKVGKPVYISETMSYSDYLANTSDRKLSETEFRKQQVENRIMQIQREILLNPDNYENLTKSLDDTADIIKELTNEIYKLRTGKDRSKGSVLDILDRINLTNVADRFLSSKQAVGITALASPFHILAQMSGLYINEFDNKGNSNRIFLKRESKSGNISLANELDANGANIADILRQWISEAVDAAKDPRMFDLNVNLETLNVVLYLTMAGVPTKDILYFINQPIIFDFLNLKSIGKAKFKAVNKKKVPRHDGTHYYRSETMGESEVKKIIINKYGGNAAKSTSEFTLSELEENIKFGLKIGVEKLDKVKHIEGGQSAEIDKFNADQVRILNEYLKYKETANILTKAIQGASWDTNSAGKTVPELLLRKYNTDEALNTLSYKRDSENKLQENGKLIGNYDKLLKADNSFITPYYQNNIGLESQYAPLFKIMLGNPNVKKMVKFLISRYNDDFNVSKDETVEILNNFVAGYLSYQMITKPLNKDFYVDDESFNKSIEDGTNSIISSFDKLFKGNSTAKKIDAIQEMIYNFDNFNKLPGITREFLRNKYGKFNGEFNQEGYDRRVRLYKKLRDNKFMKVLIPNVSTEEGYYDHVIVKNSKKDNYEINAIVDGWKSLLYENDYLTTPGDVKEIGLNLLKLAIKQEGISPSPNNFIHFAPADLYTKLAKLTYGELNKDEELARLDDFNYFLQFHLQFVKNNNIVPNKEKGKKDTSKYPFVRGIYEYKTEAKPDEIAFATTKGKQNKKDVPFIYTTKDTANPINSILAPFYKNQTLGKNLSVYGENNIELSKRIGNDLRDTIFSDEVKKEDVKNEVKETVETKSSQSNETLNNWNEYTKVLQANDITTTVTQVEFSNLSIDEQKALIWEANNCF